MKTSYVNVPKVTDIDPLDRASDTTDSGISIRPLGNDILGIEERSDKASQTMSDMTTANNNQGP